MPTCRRQRRAAKTPYQGRKRGFGKFRCRRCGREWGSGHSWANMGQKCRGCSFDVYPYSQRPLRRRREHDAPKRAHPRHLCGMCTSLGDYCGNYDERDQR